MESSTLYAIGLLVCIVFAMMFFVAGMMFRSWGVLMGMVVWLILGVVMGWRAQHLETPPTSSTPPPEACPTHYRVVYVDPAGARSVYYTLDYPMSRNREVYCFKVNGLTVMLPLTGTKCTEEPGPVPQPAAQEVEVLIPRTL